MSNTRINHIQYNRMNIGYWDYLILCQGDAEAALILQRMEMWDGTKHKGNVLSERLNEVMVSQGDQPTQDTGKRFYKAQDELAWELQGVVGESHLSAKLKKLITTWRYLSAGHNPIYPMDRKLQYEMNVQRVQPRLDHLGTLVSFFHQCELHIDVIQRAIEEIIKTTFIDDLSPLMIIDQLLLFTQQVTNEKEAKNFHAAMRYQIKKDQQIIISLHVRLHDAYRKFTEWGNVGVSSSNPQEESDVRFRKLKQYHSVNLSNLSVNLSNVSIDYVSIDYLPLEKDNVSVTAHADDAPHSPADCSIEELEIALAHKKASLPTETSSFRQSVFGEKAPAQPALFQDVSSNPGGVEIHEKKADLIAKGDTAAQPDSSAVSLNALPWGPEKALALAEDRVGKKYLARDKQLAACKKLLATYHPTEELYIKVIEKILPWWKDHKKLLHPTDLVVNSPRKVVRWLEVVEDLEYATEQQAPDTHNETETPSLPEGMQERVASVYTYLNQWAQKTISPEWRFTPDTESDKAICDLLTCPVTPTPVTLEKVCKSMWADQFYHDNMAVRTICKRYKSMAPSLIAVKKAAETKKPFNIEEAEALMRIAQNVPTTVRPARLQARKRIEV